MFYQGFGVERETGYPKLTKMVVVFSQRELKLLVLLVCALSVNVTRYSPREKTLMHVCVVSNLSLTVGKSGNYP